MPWATIRGFVYKVNNTLHRWLQLLSGQHLELKCGEDMGVVYNNLIAGTQCREIEQLKFRDSDTSPNRAEVLGILKDHLLH